MPLDFSGQAEPLDFSAQAQPLDFSGQADTSEPQSSKLMGFSDRTSKQFKDSGLTDFSVEKQAADNFSLKSVLDHFSNAPYQDLHEFGAAVNGAVSTTLGALAGAYKLATSQSFDKARKSFEDVTDKTTLIHPDSDALKVGFDLLSKGFGAATQTGGIAVAEAANAWKQVTGKEMSQEDYDKISKNAKFLGDVAATLAPVVHGIRKGFAERPKEEGSIDAILASIEDENKTPDTPVNQESVTPNTDVNAIPEDTSFMDSKGQGLSLEPLPEKPVAPVDNGTIDYEKVDPATLRNTQGELDFSSQGNEIPYRENATPQQGADFIDTLQNDKTQTKGEIPYQESLPGVNSGKFGQGGAVDPNVFAEAFGKLFSRKEEPTISNNASGESAASAEAINRLKQQNDSGIKLFELDPERNSIIPLKTADRVDKRAAQGKAIVQQDRDGNISIIENNSRFGNTPLTNRSKSMLAKQAPLGGVGKRGFGQGGAISFGGAAKTSLEQQAKKISQEEWVPKFLEKYPQYANRPEVAGRVYQQLNPSEKPVTNLADAIEKNKFLKGVDKGLGVVSTRIGNISQPILHRAIKFEKGILEQTHKKISRVDDFLVEINKNKKVSPETKRLIDGALLDNDTTRLNRILEAAGLDELIPKYKEVREVLKETGNELVGAGRLEGLRDDYFPRIVKDVDGLLATLGTEKRNALETRLYEARQKAQKNGETLSDIDESKIVNSYLRNTMKGTYKPGFSKERKLDSIPEEFQKFYATPTQALHTYLRNAVQEIETAKFFGRDAVKNPETNKIDIDQSIGAITAKELREGKVSGEQAAELESILKSRFGPGNQASNLAVQTVSDAANIGLLGNVISTVTHGGDLIFSLYLNDLRPTMTAVVNMVGGKSKISTRDFGLLDHISEEFVNQRRSAQFLNKVYRATGFHLVDKLGKDLILNSSLKNGEHLVKTPAGLSKFKHRWGERFGDEFPQLVDDLAQGKRTELTDLYAFSNLSKLQPLTKLELPQKYHDMPNGRIIYMLKSFVIKQADIIRNDAYNEIKKGNIKEGLSNLARYSMILGISGATTGYIKDWLMGRDVDPELSDVPLNVLKTFGWAEYTADKIKQGRVGEALGDLALPPYKMFDIIGREAVQEFDGNPNTNAKGKSLNYLPIVGRLLYERKYGGAEEYNKKERSKQFRDMVRGVD